MKLKLDCPCGTQFAIEFEPVNNAVPFVVKCPACAHDGTSFTNFMLQQLQAQGQLPATPPPPSSVIQPRISLGAPPAASPSPSPAPAPAPAAPPAPVVQPRVQIGAAPAGAPAPAAEASPAAPTKPGLSISRSHPPTPATAPPPPPAPEAPPPPPGLAAAAASKVVPLPATGASGLPVPDADAPRCAKHGREPSTGVCLVCKVPICLRCMEVFGYFCSSGCRFAAEKHKLEVPVCPYQKSVVDSQLWSKVGRIAASIIAVLLLIAGFLIWYEFVGSQPRTYYTIKTGEETPIHFAHLIDANHLLVVDAKAMALHDLKTKKPVWTTALASDAAAADPDEEPEEMPEQADKPGKSAKGGGPRSSASAMTSAAQEALEQGGTRSPGAGLDRSFRWHSYSPPPRVHLAANEVWLCFPTKLERFDLQSGQSKQSIPLRGRRFSFTPSEKELLVVTMPTSRTRVLTRVSLPDGKIETSEVALGKAEKILVSKENSAAAPTSGELLRREFEESQQEYRDKIQRRFVTAGAGLVEFESKVLQAKAVNVQTVKADNGKSRLNSKLSAASNTGAVAEDIFNDLKRTSGEANRVEDVSTYQVTVRRFSEGETLQWEKEMTGPPAFYPFKTVDLVVAGKTAILLDRQNKVITETKLNYNVVGAWGGVFDDGDENQHSPGLELGNQLLIFDQGVLTAFELPSGEIKWRLTTVGISRIVPDGRGSLYISSTTATPDSIQYSDQVNITDRPRDVVLKVQAATGKILWQVENRGRAQHYGNKLLFTSETIQAGGLMSLGKTGENPDNYRIYRLNPANGKELFEYYHKGRPESVDFLDTRIVMRFENEVKVLKFMAL